MNKYLIRKISLIICLLLVLSFVQSYAGVHFGIISAVKSKVQELKNKKEQQQNITETETVDSAGGEIELPDGASVVIPPGVLNSTTTVTLTRYDTPLTSIGNDQALSSTYRLQIPRGSINSGVSVSSSSIILRIPIEQNNNNSSIISKTQNISASSNSTEAFIRIDMENCPTLFASCKISDKNAATEFPVILLNEQSDPAFDYLLVNPATLEDVPTKWFKVTNNPYNVEVQEDTSIVIVNPEKVPVIFIHGLVVNRGKGDTTKENPHRDWDKLIKYLFKENLNFEPYLFRYDTKKSIASNSAELQRIIDYNFQNIPKIIIVAHSMGGLVAHNYIQSPNLKGYEKVSKLITLGTPFHGSPFAGAEIATRVSLGNCEGTKNLKWDYYDEESSEYDSIRNQFLYDLYKSTTVYTSTKYVVFAGNFNDIDPENSGFTYEVTNSFLKRWSVKYSQPNWAYNDCVVPFVSATYYGRSNLISTKHEYGNYDHSELQQGTGATDDPIFKQISEEINHAPGISSLTANPTSISTGTISTITCTATDSDGDTLTYNWSTLSGIITGTGEQVSWTAPVSSGTYTINCSVSDGKGGSDTESVNILVQNSTTNSKIAFVNNAEIYVIDSDGSNQINLTNDTSNSYWGPIWSPDGGKIVFAKQNDIFKYETYVMNSDGSNQINLTNDPSDDYSQPVWSPSGNKIAFVKNGDIYVMNSDGTNQINLTNDSLKSDWNPVWSPDGNKIAFIKDYQIYLMNADGSNQINLTNDSSKSYLFPVWAPSGNKILFIRSDTDVEIYVMNADGSNKINLTNDSSKEDTDPKWSPDGNKIVFGKNGDIYVMNADGSNQINLTNDSLRSNKTPDWSPDGNKIVFAKDGDIYVMNADGSNQIKLTNSPYGCVNPIWSPNLINNLPNTPTSTPSVSTPVYVNRYYTYSISATDPDNDKVKYRFDWGNGQTSETEYVDSGTVASISHIWTTVGTKSVKVKTIDSKGNESLNWSPVLSIVVKLDSGSGGEI